MADALSGAGLYRPASVLSVASHATGAREPSDEPVERPPSLPSYFGVAPSPLRPTTISRPGVMAAVSAEGGAVGASSNANQEKISRPLNRDFLASPSSLHHGRHSAPQSSVSAFPVVAPAPQPADTCRIRDELRASRSRSSSGSGIDLPDIPDPVFSAAPTPSLRGDFTPIDGSVPAAVAAIAPAVVSTNRGLDFHAPTDDDPNDGMRAFDGAVRAAEREVAMKGPDAALFSASSLQGSPIGARDDMAPSTVAGGRAVEMSTQTERADTYDSTFAASSIALEQRGIGGRTNASVAYNDGGGLKLKSRHRVIVTPVACVTSTSTGSSYLGSGATERRDHYASELARFYSAQFDAVTVAPAAPDSFFNHGSAPPPSSATLEALLNRIPDILDAFHGHEEDLFRLLRHKYSAPRYVFRHADGRDSLAST